MKYMSKVKHLLTRDFVRHNIIFFVGTLLISIFNYLYYPVIGRMVSVESFGEIQALISLFIQLGIILTAFGYVVTNITNNAKDSRESMALILRLERITLVLCLFIFVLLSLLSYSLKSSLQFTSVGPLILVGILIVLNVPSTARTYYLQGEKRLKEVSVTGIIFAAGKLVLSVLFIFLFFAVTAAILGYIVALVLSLGYLVLKTGGVFPGLGRSFKTKSADASVDRKTIKDELVYGLAILILLSGVTLLYSSDTVVVRLFFNPVEAGLYSAVSAVARIVFFVTASVAGVLLATVKIGEKYSKNLSTLFSSFGIVTLIGGAVALLFALFPTFSMQVLFGNKYTEAAGILPVLALVMLICSYNNLLVSFEIALRRFKVIYIVLISMLAGGLLIWMLHDTLMHIVMGYLAANVMVFVLLSVHIVTRKRNV